MTYLVVSDLHANNWTLFAKADSDGVNSRLRLMLNELLRANDELQKAGGNLMVIAGDILHTRGVIDPEVLNPLREAFDQILSSGTEIVAIPGNHDLKSAETNELASSIQNLVQIHPIGASFRVFNEPTVITHTSHYDEYAIALVPWRNTRDQLLADLEELTKHPMSGAHMEVFIHAGIDGVLSGMPAHGLTAAKLAGFGFKRVFAGHYHNHKDFGNGVYSIGALTHQNWGDIGTKAGFLLVNDTSVKFHTTQAPRFIDISGLDEDEIALEAPGNYCRFRGPSMTQDQVNDLRRVLNVMGAAGTSIEVPRTSSVLRTTSPSKGLTLEQSIEGFVKNNPPAHADPAEVLKRAVEVLHQSQAVVA